MDKVINTSFLFLIIQSGFLKQTRTHILQRLNESPYSGKARKYKSGLFFWLSIIRCDYNGDISSVRGLILPQVNVGNTYKVCVWISYIFFLLSTDIYFLFENIEKRFLNLTQFKLPSHFLLFFSPSNTIYIKTKCTYLPIPPRLMLSPNYRLCSISKWTTS